MRQRETEKLFNGLTGISEDLIVEAQMMSLQKKKQVWPKIVAAAAVVLIIYRFAFTGLVPAPTRSVEVPRLELSGTPQGDMLSLLIVGYRGDIYTAQEYYYGEQAVKIRPLLDKLLGKALGNLNEWSAPSEYSREFASTETGDVFTVKGYDPEFRLSIAFESADEAGRAIPVVVFVERLNGIALERGQELFADRMKVKGRITKIEYLPHHEWNEGQSGYRELPPLEEGQFDAFLDAVNEAQVQYLNDEEWFYYGSSSRKQGHLLIHLTDFTRIRLMLFEGGYVSYPGLSGYVVKVPEQKFDVILETVQ